jgi:hypothetical protein
VKVIFTDDWIAWVRLKIFDKKSSVPCHSGQDTERERVILMQKTDAWRKAATLLLREKVAFFRKSIINLCRKRVIGRDEGVRGPLWNLGDLCGFFLDLLRQSVIENRTLPKKRFHPSTLEDVSV